MSVQQQSLKDRGYRYSYQCQTPKQSQRYNNPVDEVEGRSVTDPLSRVYSSVYPH